MQICQVLKAWLKLGNIVADANVSQFSRAGNVLRRQILLLGKQKLFLPRVKNFFASRTQVLRPKHMFPSLATPGNITRNIVSAKMFPSLARPLQPSSSRLLEFPKTYVLKVFKEFLAKKVVALPLPRLDLCMTFHKCLNKSI